MELKNKTVLFLGSSVTYGSAAGGISFVDILGERCGINCIKEAVSGTTLVDIDERSYISRLKALGTAQKPDLFICQLSTNDATRKKPLGEVSYTQFPDRNTVCGAIEYIINYIRDVWDCPVIFYTNSYYNNDYYADMVDAMKKIASVYGVGLIDLYSDSEFNKITSEQRKIYMADDIHPTKEGYTEWWTPKMEEYLYKYLRERVER